MSPPEYSRFSNILLSSNGEIQAESNLFIERHNNDLTIITCDETQQSIVKGLEANGIRVLSVKKDLKSGQLDLINTFKNIANIGINNLFVEPGVMLFGSLIDCALPDDIIIFKSHEGLGEFGLKVPQINQLLNNENSEYQKNYEKIIFDTTMSHYKKIR